MQDQDTPRQVPDVKNGVLVLTGYGLRVAVRRGQLLVSDGHSYEPRSGTFSRAFAGLRRLVVLGHSGTITFEALRWLHDVGVSFVQIDGDGQVMLASGPMGLDDARLRRAQAFAMGHPVGLEVARAILREKLLGEHEVLKRLTGTDRVQAALDAGIRSLERAKSLDSVLFAEASAAAAYWGAWAEVPMTFARADVPRIPGHWKTFGQRSSPLTRSPRSAANPANALENYAYAVLEAEARIACLAVGLDPGLGVIHADQRARDSMALDLMDAVRPAVDSFVLDLLQGRTFRACDFHETRQGVCRVLPPLTQLLAQTAPRWAARVAPVAEKVARMLAEAPGSRISRIPTPLTRANRRAGRAPFRRTTKAPRRVPEPALEACRRCGGKVPSGKRAYCDDCLPEFQRETLEAGAESGRAKLAVLMAQGRDPSHGGNAARKRGAKNAVRMKEASQWEGTQHKPADRRDFRRDVLPRLQGVPLRRIAKATGLSLQYCSLVRRGLYVPHQRHWEGLKEVSTAPSNVVTKRRPTRSGSSESQPGSVV